jgi:hypothetical protein
MKFSIPSSYGQVYLCATSIKDFPDWDDESFEKGLARTKDGVSLGVADDENISVSFKEIVPPANFHCVGSVSLISTDGNYELSSPLFLDNGAILRAEGGALDLDIYTDSAHPENVMSAIFVTSARISLVKPFGGFYKPR